MRKGLSLLTLLLAYVAFIGCGQAHRWPRNVPSSAVYVDGVFIDCSVEKAHNENRCTVFKDGTGEILADGFFGAGDPPTAVEKPELAYVGYTNDGGPGPAILLRNSRVLSLVNASGGDPTNRLIRERLQSLASTDRQDATDCGDTAMDKPDASVSSCIQTAFASRKSFYARYFDDGNIRYISYGLASDPAGNVFEVVYNRSGLLNFNLGKNEQVFDDYHIRVRECIKPVTLGKTEEGMIACVTTINAEASAAAAHQKRIDTTICEILKDPSAFNNTIVRVRGHFSGNFEYSVLSGNGCSGSIWFAYSGDGGPPSLVAYVAGGALPGAVDSEGRRILPVPVKLVEDKRFRRFEQLVKAGAVADARPQGDDPTKFVFHQVTATFVGRIDAVSPDIHAFHLKRKDADRADFLGFGQMGLFDAQFVLQSVESRAILEKESPPGSE